MPPTEVWDFRSDNTAGATPEVLRAVAEASAGSATPYGDDPWARRLEDELARVFEHEVVVFPVATGTAANALALAALTPPHGAVYCHPESHVYAHECGAPELFTGGAKLLPVDGADGKLDAAGLEAVLAAGGGPGGVHHVRPSTVSLSQLGDLGAAYSVDEVSDVAGVCRRHGLRLHLDGARLANALLGPACRGASLADLTWRAGVDAVSFGATKNGAIAAEAIVFFDAPLAYDMGRRRKRGGHLWSKSRFLSAQLLALLEDGRWLDQARHANRMARELVTGLADVVGVEVVHPVEGNLVFVRWPARVHRGLEADGWPLVAWSGGEETVTTRLVPAWNTPSAAVGSLVSSVRSLAG